MKRKKALTPIEQEYKRLRKNALERARYWRKKGVEIPVPKKPKRITEASLRKLQQNVEKAAEKAKRPAKKKKTRPTMEEIILRRVREIIDRGLASGEWEAYKASLARDIVEENLPDPGTPQRKATLKRWADSLGGLDDAVERFIFDSGQNLSGSAWQTILSIITGNNYFPDFGVSDFEDEFLE